MRSIIHAELSYYSTDFVNGEGYVTDDVSDDRDVGLCEMSCGSGGRGCYVVS